MQLSQEQISGMVSLIRERKREGFDMLYTTFAAPIYGLLCRMTGDKAVAENLLEATFVSICNNIDTYNGEVSFCTWLLQQVRAVSRRHVVVNNGVVYSDAIELILIGSYVHNGAKGKQADNVKALIRNNKGSYR